MADNTFWLLHQNNVNSCAFCHNISSPERDFNHLDISIEHYTSPLQCTQNYLDLLDCRIKDLRGFSKTDSFQILINSGEAQNPTIWVNVSGTKWSWAYLDSSFTCKYKLFHLQSPTINKGIQCLIHLFGIWKQYIKHVVIIFWHIYCIGHKAENLG